MPFSVKMPPFEMLMSQRRRVFVAVSDSWLLIVEGSPYTSYVEFKDCSFLSLSAMWLPCDFELQTIVGTQGFPW